MTIVGESLQKISKNGETFSSRRGLYLVIYKKWQKKSTKDKKMEKVAKDKTFVASWKETKVFSKSSPFIEYTFAGFAVSCRRQTVLEQSISGSNRKNN
jgi:hypothetical protein